MKLSEFLRPDNVIEITAADREGVLQELVHQAAQSKEVFDEDALMEGVMEREHQNTTGIGHGIAVPHCRSDWIDGFIVVFGRAKAPVDFRSLDGKPVTIVVLVAAGADQNKAYIQVLSRIALALRDEEVRAAVHEAGSPEEIYQILIATENP